jgi:hypothetical protein
MTLSMAERTPRPKTKPKPGTVEYGLHQLWAKLEDNRRVNEESESKVHAIDSKMALAAELKVTKQAMSVWVDRVPVRHVLIIEKLLGMNRSILRPDVYPPDQSRVQPSEKPNAKRRS